MSGLGLLGAAAMGFAGGSARGYLEVNKAYDDKQLLQQQQEADLQKEKRLEEQTIRKENRDVTNDAFKQQAEIDRNTDPANVQRMNEAKLSTQQAADDYKYDNQGREAEYEGLLSRAKHIEGPDRTDYEGRKLQNEGRVLSNKQRQYNLDHPESAPQRGNSKTPWQTKARLEMLIKEKDSLQEKIDADPTFDVDNKMGKLNDEIDAILNSNGEAIKASNGYTEEEVKAKIDRIFGMDSPKKEEGPTKRRALTLEENRAAIRATNQRN